MHNKANKQAGKQNWTMEYLSEDDGRPTKAWCKAKAKVTQPKRKDTEKQTGKAQKQKHCELHAESKSAQHISSRAAFPTPTGRREYCANKASSMQNSKQAKKSKAKTYLRKEPSKGETWGGEWENSTRRQSEKTLHLFLA
jgi:hypothetical protein